MKVEVVVELTDIRAISQAAADTMLRDEVETLFARRQEAWQNLDAAALASEYSDHCIVDTPSAGMPLVGRAANEQQLRRLFAAFPDLQHHVEVRLIDGNYVAEFGTSSGTDIGGFMELQPSGKSFRVPFVCMYTLKGRHIIHERRMYDFTSLLVQVGILKVKPT